MFKRMGISLHARRLAFALLCGFAMPAAAGADSLGQIKQRDGIHIDPDQISISGLSSGAWLAVQYHIAHSSQIMGVGVVAGGPYHCAGSWSTLCFADALVPHDVCQASYVCSRTAAKLSSFGFYWGPPDLEASVSSAKQEDQGGAIDPLVGLKRARVWVFTGGRETDAVHDTLMPHEVVQETADFYRRFVDNPDQNIKFVDSVPAEHAMPINDDPTGEAGQCSVFGEPFISACAYPAASELLGFIYPGRPQATTSHWTEDRLQTFAQAIDPTDPSVSMNKFGHIYVPHACMQGQSCPLHIALHGCEQDEQSLDKQKLPSGDAVEALPPEKRPYFYRLGGYNEWAEQRGVVILYPQARAEAGTLNPNGCWDWYGYSGPDYYVRTGKQITAINAMVECLKGTGPCR